MTKRSNKKKRFMRLSASAAAVVMAVSPLANTGLGEHSPFATKEAHANSFAGGTGTVNDPFQISTPEQLRLIEANRSSHFVLINDIELNGVKWEPLCTTATTAFEGTLDGRGYKIKNLSIESSLGSVGFFSIVGKAADSNSKTSISNLVFEKANVKSTTSATTAVLGILSGTANRTKFKNIKFIGNNNLVFENTSKFSLAGFLFGNSQHLLNDSIEKVYAEGNINIKSKGTTAVTSTYGIGGIGGEFHGNGATIKEVISNVKVNAPNSVNVGGVFGRITQQVYLSDVISYQEIRGANFVGGISGQYTATASSGHGVKNAINFGDVISSTNTAGSITARHGGNQNYDSVFALNSKLDGLAGAGKFTGHNTSDFLGKNRIINKNMVSGGHEFGITARMTPEEYTNKQKFIDYGLPIGEGVWDIVDGVTTPFLTFHPMTAELIDGEWVAVPVDPDLIEDTTDKEPPAQPTLTPNTTAPTNQNVTVTISYSTDSVTKQYRVNGGAWMNYTSAVTMTANGTVEARATDEAGNISSIGTLTVSNMDKIAPTTPTVTPNTTAPTNQDVTVTISYPSDATTKQYRIDSGSWTTYTGPVTMTMNGKVEARGLDAAGNTSPIGSLTVSNIDTVTPTAPTLTPNTTAPTNQDVTVTISYPSDATTKQYRIDGGSWTTYTSAVTMTENGTIEARGLDAAGNTSPIGTLTVSNIHKVAPIAPTLTPSTTELTKNPVTVTISYSSKVVTKEYRINGGSWTTYTGPVTMTANGKVEARGIDATGNSSPIGSLEISNISTVPTLTELKMIDRSYDFIDIGWTLSHALSDVDEFVILRDGEEIKRVPFRLNQTTYQFKDESLPPGAMHDYTVQLISNGAVADTKTMTSSTYELETPQGLSLIKATDSTLKIGWVEVENAHGYIIKRDGVEVGRTKNPFFTDSDLTFATSYDYEVYAETAYGVSDPARITARTSNELYSITLEWEAVEDAISYNIYRDNVLVDNTSETRYVDFEVERGKLYDYDIKPVFEGDAEGESITDFELLPDVATDIRLDVAQEQVVATWDDFETLYGIETPHYQVIVEKRLADGTYEMVGNPLQVNEERFVFKDFEHETTYRITVVPFMNGAYQERLAAEKEFTTLEASEVPKVQNVQAVLQGNTAHVTWDAFEGATRYRIQTYVYDELTGEYVKDGFMRSVTGTSYLSNALTDGRQYKFEVIPFSNKLLSESSNFSNEVTVTVTPPVEEPSPENPAGAYNFNVEMNGTTATLTWDEMEDATRYRVSLYKKLPNGQFERVGTNRAIAENMYKYENLLENIEYEFMVEPRIGYVYETKQALRKKATVSSKTPTEETPPSQVTIPNASVDLQGKKSIITWEPAVINDETITAYRILRYVKDDLTGQFKLELTRSTTKTNYTDVYKLVSGKTYQYEILPFVNGVYSQEYKFVTDEFVNP